MTNRNLSSRTLNVFQSLVGVVVACNRECGLHYLEMLIIQKHIETYTNYIGRSSASGCPDILRTYCGTIVYTFQIMRMLLTSPLNTAISAAPAGYDSDDEAAAVAAGHAPDHAPDHAPASVDLELIALAINLAANRSCAELICGQDGAGLKLVRGGV